MASGHPAKKELSEEEKQRVNMQLEKWGQSLGRDTTEKTQTTSKNRGKICVRQGLRRHNTKKWYTSTTLGYMSSKTFAWHPKKYR